MRFKLNLLSPKILFYFVPFLFCSFFIFPNFVYAYIPCNGPGQECSSWCGTGYVEIGECQATGLLGAREKCCQKDEGPSLKAAPGTNTSEESSSPAPSAANNPEPGDPNAAPTPEQTKALNTSTPSSPTPSAASNPEPGDPNVAPTPAQAQALGLTADTSKSLVPCTDNCTLCDIIVGIKRIFDYFMTLLVIVATLFIIIAGIAYMVSGGSKSLMEWAKKALMYALIGFVLYLASWLIVSSILSAMGYNRTGWSTFDCESGS